MFDRLKRFRNVVILAVLCSGLADVLLEIWLGAALPPRVRLALRTVFWVSALLWIALRISEKMAEHTGPEDSESK